MSLQAPEPRLSSGAPLSTALRYLERALDYYAHKKYDNALADMDQAIRQEPRNGEFYATRGYILVEAGFPQEAEADLDKALKIDPRQWLAHYIRGVSAFQQNQFDAALAHFSNAQRIVPLRPEIYIYRAAIFYHKGDKANAQKEIDAAMQTMPPEDKRLKEARKWQSTIKKMR